MDMKFKRSYLATSLVLALTHSAISFAETRIDFDLDDDGLIEINNLADLNQIRHEITEQGMFKFIKGNTLYGENTGCPTDGCIGYELTTDLDFDTNGDQQVNAQDEYWNDGKGFEPIGNFGLKFTAEFNGNNHLIKNLTIIRPEQNFNGLFAYLEEADIHDLKLQAYLETNSTSGALIGYAWRTRVTNISASVTVIAPEQSTENYNCIEGKELGGLIGVLDGSSSAGHLQVDANITGCKRIGGIFGSVGDVSSDITLTHLASKFTGTGFSSVGGIAGHASNATIEKSYAESHITGYSNLGGILGVGDKSNITDSLVTGSITLSDSARKYARAGGAMGSDASEGSQSTLTRIISLVSFEDVQPGDQYFIGGISGDSLSLINGSVYAVDLAKRSKAFGNGRNLEMTSDLSDIQCADEKPNQCNGLSFPEHASIKNHKNQALWAFGNNTQAPSINIMDLEFTDADGNGATDNWPTLIKEVPTTEPDKPEPIDEKPEPIGEKPNESTSKSSGGGSLQWFILLALLLVNVRKTKH